MDKSEQELRTQLAACYRIFDYLGWDELIYNHITVRLPDNNEHFLINPYGLHYSEVCASNLIKVDIKGNIIGESQYKPNPAGMIIHTAIHEARHDVCGIAHLHTDAASVVACQKEGLRHDNFYSVLLHNQVAYHNFEGITVMPGEKARLVESLGDKYQLILRNHGILSCGRNIPETFMNIWLLQRACEIQMATDMSGKPNIAIGEDIAKRSEELIKIQSAGAGYGVLEFNAMVRKIDKLDDSYKI